jgi:hypothetical protein
VARRAGQWTFDLLFDGGAIVGRRTLTPGNIDAMRMREKPRDFGARDREMSWHPSFRDRCGPDGAPAIAQAPPGALE